MSDNGMPTEDELTIRILEQVCDENYTDLLDDMDERWGNAREVGRSEINAFLESRIVHKPAASLRARIKTLEGEIARANVDPENAICAACGKHFYEHSCNRPPLGQPKTDELAKARAAGIAEAATLIPTNWTDPILTGKDAVVNNPPWRCPDVEKILRAVKARLESVANGEVKS